MRGVEFPCVSIAITGNGSRAEFADVDCRLREDYRRKPALILRAINGKVCKTHDNELAVIHHGEFAWLNKI